VIVTVILAAGRSSRMGKSKALLPHADGATTFLAYAMETCRAAGVVAIIVVGRPGDAAVAEEAARLDARFVINPEPDRGQLSSLLVGLDAADQDFAASAIMVLPVDVALITTEGVRAVVDRARTGRLPIVRAAYGDRHGHPVIFKREVFDELRAADPTIGARAVVHADPSRVADVQVEHADALADVDTPEDYRRAFGRSV
jgi:molybdenum cofactor cytidylyltransferase